MVNPHALETGTVFVQVCTHIPLPPVGMSITKSPYEAHKLLPPLPEGYQRFDSVCVTLLFRILILMF